MAVSDPMMGRCTARSKQTGARCGHRAILGGTVCRHHGGGAPQVKEAAADRLRALQHSAIDRIAKLIDQEQFPSVSYAASKDVLDRTMGRATEVVEMTHSADTESLIAILDAWKRRNQQEK